VRTSQRQISAKRPLPCASGAKRVDAEPPPPGRGGEGPPDGPSPPGRRLAVDAGWNSWPSTGRGLQAACVLHGGGLVPVRAVQRRREYIDHAGLLAEWFDILCGVSRTVLADRMGLPEVRGRGARGGPVVDYVRFAAHAASGL